MDLLTVLEHKLFLEGFWREWFNVDYGFGREAFQNQTRVFLSSPEQFIEYVEWCKASRSPCWMTVQPFKGRNQVFTVEKLFFDFDGSLIEAWKEASTFTQHLKQYYGVEPLVAFSGCRGYHVYVWLANNQNFEDSNQAKIFYATAQRLLLKGLKFETIDQQVIGDIKRISRVPYSIHEKSRSPCTPLTQQHSPLLITSLEGFRKSGLDNHFAKLCLKHMERKSRKRLYLKPIDKEKIRPCIQAALQKPLNGGRGHLIRLAVAREFLEAGYSVDETVPLFQNQLDYNAEKTRYYVEYAQKHPAKPFKCRTIQRLGYCLGNTCPAKR